MIKAVIFDLNGIFLQSEFLSDRIARDFNVPKEEFMPRLSEIMKATRMPGAKKAFTYWEPHLRLWGIGLTEEEFWQYWFGAEKESTQMISFAKSLRQKGIHVFILSNNFKERAEYYGHYPWIHEAVDKVYFSWKSGFVKPDPKAWELVLSENNLHANECLYFDDVEKNIKAAESLGIQSFMFTTEEKLEEIVNSVI